MSHPEAQLARIDHTKVTLLHERHGHCISRVCDGSRSFILKSFNETSKSQEVEVYALLQSLGVPTLPVHDRTPHALLLEDLDASEDWRHATPADMVQPEVGRAASRWYRSLHDAGSGFLANGDRFPDYLSRQTDSLDAELIRDLARRLRLDDEPVWQLAVDTIEPLKCATRALPHTLTYNDFHWSNLALSRHDDRAIVYDYHLLGIGLRFSDCRNVTSVLAGEGQREFWSAYGAVGERESVLDAPLATLYALRVAAERPTLPAWSAPLLAQVTSGELERNIRRAMQDLPTESSSSGPPALTD